MGGCRSSRERSQGAYRAGGNPAEPGPPSMEERWLTVAYCAHGLFCDCKEPKKHLEKCLTDAIADAEGDRHGGGEGGSGDVTFDIGIDALIAAADIR
nr:ORF2 [Torque teno sus virus k2a]